MVCEHGILRVPIVVESFRPCDYFGKCGMTPTGEAAKRPSVFDCQYLMDPTGESIKVANCGCGAMTLVYECELFGRCTPIPTTKRAAIKQDGVKLCRDCEHNPATASIL